MPDLPTVESTLDALEALKSPLSEIPESELKPIRVNAVKAWYQAVSLHQQAEALLPLLAREYSPERAQAIQVAHSELLRYARAYVAAEVQLDESVRKNESANLSDMRNLEAQLREDDARWTKWAKSALSEHPQEGANLRRITAGTGSQDTALDVLALVAMFRRNWTALETEGWLSLLERNGLTPETLEASAQRATQWMDLKALPKVVHESRLLRQRAFTALKVRYDLLMQTGRLLLPKLSWQGLVSRTT